MRCEELNQLCHAGIACFVFVAIGIGIYKLWGFFR